MTLRDVDYKTLAEALRAYAGTALDRRRAALLEARLEQIARARGMNGVEPFIEDLRHSDNPGELIDGLVNCETSFFRDTNAFKALREHVIPQVMINRDKVRRLRVLCAGCSTGQEAYSIAMLVREHFPELSRWTVEITGIDVSAKRVEHASLGRYNERDVERGVPPALVPRYFQKDAHQLRVTAALRAFTRFHRANLVEPWIGLIGYDIVLLRNVLIYLDQTAKAAMLQRARESLHSNGFLLLGAAETVSAAGDAFRRAPWSGYPIYQRYDH